MPPTKTHANPPAQRDAQASTLDSLPVSERLVPFATMLNTASSFSISINTAQANSVT